MIGNTKDTFFIIDFDHTITTGTSTSTFGMFRESGDMQQEFMDENSSLYEFYHQYEIDHSLTQQERGRYMYDWHFQSFELLKKYQLQQENFQKILEKQRELMTLRGGLADFFSLALKKDIPVVIYSAGMTQMIEHFLAISGVLSSNIYVVANPMFFGNDGLFEGVDINQFIYATEKNWSILATILPSHIVSRKNCVVVGDMVDDLTMAPSIDDGYTVHSVGIINSKHHHISGVYETFFDQTIYDDISEQGKLLEIIESI